MKTKNFSLFHNLLFSIMVIIAVFLIYLSFITQDVLADVCNKYWTCVECMTMGQSDNCIWIQNADACMNRNELKGYPTGDYYRYCASKASSQQIPTSSTLKTPTSVPKSVSTRTPTPRPTLRPTPTLAKGQCRGDSNCKSYSCKNCWVGQRVCISGYCQECASDYQCNDGFHCIASICAPKSAPTKTAKTSGVKPKLAKPTENSNICGNDVCEPWSGEDCKSCPHDCDVIPGFCCVGEANFIQPADYYNGLSNDKKAEAGLIPEGAYMIPSDQNSGTYFIKNNFQICSAGRLVKGGCLTNGHCPKGYCTTDKGISHCIYFEPEKKPDFQATPSKTHALSIREEATDYRIAYIESYKQVKDQTTQWQEEAGLSIELEVQGDTAGKLLEVTEKKPVEVRMYIKNISRQTISVTGDIVYKKEKSDVFTVFVENGTTINYDYFDDNGILNWGSLFGSIKSRIVGARYFVLNPDGEVIIHSTISPNEPGEIEVVGTVFYTGEKRFAKRTTKLEKNAAPYGEVKFTSITKDVVTKNDTFGKDAQEVQLTKTIKVNKKKCGFWGC